jgi:hypothetical protein
LFSCGSFLDIVFPEHQVSSDFFSHCFYFKNMLWKCGWKGQKKGLAQRSWWVPFIFFSGKNYKSIYHHLFSYFV